MEVPNHSFWSLKFIAVYIGLLILKLNFGVNGTLLKQAINHKFNITSGSYVGS
ncbi:MAG: hypothetical protein ACFE9S_17800 [Candidatus Hermodarchaeota archaeon]